MKDEFNIWGINNLTINFSEDSEEGQMKLIAKDGDVTRKTNEQRQKFLAKSINRDKLPAELRMITEIKLVCYNLSSLERPGGVEAEPVAVGAYDVFLSYSSLDSDYATELQSVLEQAGLKVFRDRNHLELGSRFDPSIRNALLSAHEIVILCSPSSIASDWVKRELGAAWALGKAVTPVVLHMEIDLSLIHI